MRYQCGPDGDSVISSLIEPRSCHYLITIRTPRLCKHPAFRERPPTVGIIKCYLKRPVGGEETATAAADVVAEEAVDGAAAATAAGECPAGGDAGTCAAQAEAAGEGGHRRHVSPERVTASGPAEAVGEGLEDGRDDEGEGDGQHPRLLKTLLRRNGLDDDDDGDDGYEAPE